MHLGGRAYRPPPERFFPITFEGLWIFSWNFASVYQIWIDTFWQNFVITDDVIMSLWRHQIWHFQKWDPPSNFFSPQYFSFKFCMSICLDKICLGVERFFLPPARFVYFTDQLKTASRANLRLQLYLIWQRLIRNIDFCQKIIQNDIFDNYVIFVYLADRSVKYTYGNPYLQNDKWYEPENLTSDRAW